MTVPADGMPGLDRLRLMVRVARMYHDQGMRQPEIAERLGISQPRVSRLLKEAGRLGIVRTIVAPPDGLHAELEERLVEAFGLADAVVVDGDGLGEEVARALAPATAAYLDVTLTGGDTLGISSWSETLLEASLLIRPRPAPVADRVIQLMGGVGSPGVQMHATRLMARFADITGGTPVLVPTPAAVESPRLRAELLRDPGVAAVTSQWADVTMALVGIGTSTPSPLLARSGNAISEADQAGLVAAGAVGDVCLRYYDADGALVDSVLGDRVIGIDADTLRAVPRRVGVGGGARKHEAIRGALRGGWLSVLITDHETALAVLR